MTTRPEPALPPDETDAADSPEPPASPDPPPAPLDDCRREVAELQDAWRRALADLDNLRKRHAKELARTRDDERARTAAEWLPVLDNLELALAHARSDPASVLHGVEAVRDQAVDVMRRLGYPRQEESGVPFDPRLHEVVGVVDDLDAGPGTVARVLRPGYGRDDHQLRPMTVMVGRRQE
jgi:molecular chaperone GrpE